MNKKMKKTVFSALLTCSLLASSVMAFGMDSRITNSNVWSNTTSYGGIYATGYTTSTTKHYTSVQITSSQGESRTSDRNWGTGRIAADTSDNQLEYFSYLDYYVAVYYGF
jgi:hypothetical protein